MGIVSEILKNYAKNLVVDLLSDPDALQVDSYLTSGGSIIVLTIKPAPSEVGKIIGKQGKNTIAMRTLLESVAAKHGVRVLLEIPDGKTGSRK